MPKQKHDQTLAVGASQGALRPAPASLPFARPGSEGGEGGVVCVALQPPQDSARVPFALDTVPWRKEMSLHLTVVVKASFSALASPMTPTAEAPRFLARDVHHRNQPMAHVTAASDRVPWKINIDITALGHACAPQGTQAPELIARFAVLSKEAVVLDKKVRVIGKRASSDAAPEPFATMPIVYRRAFGGPATPSNPVGCGDDPDDDLPNVLDLDNPWRPAGFGPISVGWPVRHRLLREVPRRLLEGPVMELPRGFDWAYFQSAPADQQLPELPAGATFVLESFAAERPRVELELPKANVVGAVYGLDAAHPDAAAGLGFRLDTVHLDADEWICTLTYRAYVDVPDEATLARLVVAAGVGLDGKDPIVPAERPSPSTAAPLSPLSAAASSQPLPTGTLEISHAGPPASLPFGKAPRFVAAPPAPAQTLPVPTRAATPPMPQVVPAELPALHTTDVPRPADLRGETAPAAPTKKTPEEEIDLERHARLSVALAETGVKLRDVLAENHVEPPVWRAAEKHWRRALDDETRRGQRGLRERHDEAYVEAWDNLHPGRFGLSHYAQLARAEEQGLLSVELSEQGLDPTLGLRLRRVWRRRIAASATLREQFERELAVLRAS